MDVDAGSTTIVDTSLKIRPTIPETFRFGKGFQSPPSLFFSHVSGIVGRIFRDVIDYRP